MTAVDLNSVMDDLAVEEVASLADFAEEPGGAWASGWYKAEIIEGYTTQKGKTFLTEDGASQKGDSRNLRLCVKVFNGDSERTMQESFNYRPSDFTAERLAYIKEARIENKNVKGRWADADVQRSSLAIATLGQIEKALGQGFRRANGVLLTQPLVGKKLDVRLTIGDNGYNEITAFAPADSKTKGKR
jgi:hypothetical protein